MRPDLCRKVFDRQTDWKAGHDKSSKGREFSLVKNFWCKTSEVSRNGLVAPLRSKPVPSLINFWSKNNSGTLC